MTVTKILEQTLSAGSTSVSFTDADIPNSLIRVFSSNSDLIPVSRILSGNTLTVTYEAQSNAIDVAVEIVKAGLDIVDNVTSTDTDKALSAKQGKVLKDAIDALPPVLDEADEISYDNTDTGMTATNVQTAIDEVFQSVSDGKVLIADAITDKGVETSATDTFATMASNIESIPSGGGGGGIDVTGGTLKYNSGGSYVSGTTFTATFDGVAFDRSTYPGTNQTHATTVKEDGVTISSYHANADYAGGRTGLTVFQITSGKAYTITYNRTYCEALVLVPFAS